MTSRSFTFITVGSKEIFKVEVANACSTRGSDTVSFFNTVEIPRVLPKNVFFMKYEKTREALIFSRSVSDQAHEASLGKQKKEQEGFTK